MEKIVDKVESMVDSGSSSKIHSELALTGATGFVGKRLISQLTGAGWKVRALYRPKKGRTPPVLSGVEWVAGDLNDKEALNTLVNGTYAVIHCAGVVRGANRKDFDIVNEFGARRIADIAAMQEQIPRFLLISSLAAREPELSHYAGSKRRGEWAVKSASDTMRWTILRPPAVFGPGDREMLPVFKGIANGFAAMPAGVDGRFSMIYVDDLASAVVSWLVADDGYGQTFEIDDGLVGGYDWDTMLEIGGRVLRGGKVVRRILIPIFLLKFVASINLWTSRILGYAPMLTPGKVREITHSDWVSDTGEFEQITGWQPKYGLENGLAKLFDK